MYYIGVDVGGMSIKAGIVDEFGKILYKDSIKTEPNLPTHEIINSISLLIQSVINSNNLKNENINGIGLGFPGSVYDKAGKIRYCCNINLVDVDIVTPLQKSLNIQNIKISNDANCATLAETLFGAGKGAQNVVMITLGTGVGTGIIVDGKMLTGNQSAGAEGGHIQIDVGGAKCGCGKFGHLEAYASATALLNQTKELMEKYPQSLICKVAKENGLDGKTLFEAEKLGDKYARQGIEKYLEYVGMGLVNFANIFYPEIIIIGGGISNEGEKIIKPLQDYVTKNVYGTEYNPPIKVVTASLKNDAGIIGASCLCL